MEYLNAARGSCGFGLLAQNTKLDRSANDQALYQSTKRRNGPCCWSQPRRLLSRLHSGVTVRDRAAFRG